MANELVNGLLQSLLTPPQQQGPSPADIMAALNSRNPMAAAMAVNSPSMAQVTKGLLGQFGLTTTTPREAMQQMVAANPAMLETADGMTQLAQMAQQAGDRPTALRLSLMAQQKAQEESSVDPMRISNTEAVDSIISSLPQDAPEGLRRSLLGYRAQLATEASPSTSDKVQETLNTVFERFETEIPKPPSLVQEFEYAKAQGFTGSLSDWKQLGAARSLTVGAAPTGYRYVGNADDLRLEVIPGGPADTGMGAGEAAKASLVFTATKNMDELKGMILEYNEDGTVAGVNRTNIFNANVPGGGTPFTEGRTLNALIQDTLEAKIRAESGAAVPASEISRLAERFRPSILDKEETVVRKLKLLQDFLDNTMMFMKADGTFDSGAAVLSVDRMLRGDSDFSQMSDEDLLRIMTTPGTPE